MSDPTIIPAEQRNELQQMALDAQAAYLAACALLSATEKVRALAEGGVMEQVRAERVAEFWPDQDGTCGVRMRGDAVDGGTVWFWSEAAADAFIAQVNTEPEQLPDGVYRSQDAFFMVRHWWDDVPPGWRRRHDAHPEHECFAVERVPSVPATERVPVLQAIEQKRTAVAPDGSHMPLTDDVIVHRVKGRWSLMYDDAGHAFERRPVADADGTVEVLRQDTEAQS